MPRRKRTYHIEDARGDDAARYEHGEHVAEEIYAAKERETRSEAQRQAGNDEHASDERHGDEPAHLRLRVHWQGS